MIKLDNVTKVYSTEVVAVRDATFDVPKGEFVFLVGPSGSGKSTLLRLLNKQEQPERGTIWVAGRSINELAASKVPYLRRNIGNIFQDYKLLPNKTAFENVAFALEVIGRPKHVIRQQVPRCWSWSAWPASRSASPPAVGRRAAARVDRPGLRQPPADPPGRRAHRQPGPADQRGDHAAAGPHQQDRDHRGHGHARSAHRQHDAPPRHPARPRHHRARPGRGVYE
jgi:ABC-type dipeptide/oligopeptide/nickel transport system ATPase subunit